MSKLYTGDLCRLIKDAKPYFNKGDVVVVLENDSPNDFHEGVLNILALGVGTENKESYWLDGEILELLTRNESETKDMSEEKYIINVDTKELVEMLTESVHKALNGDGEDDWIIAESITAESFNDSREETVKEAKKFIGEVLFRATTDWDVNFEAKYTSDLLESYYTAPRVLYKRVGHEISLEGTVRGIVDGREYRKLTLHIDTTKEVFNYHLATALLLSELYDIDRKHLSFSEERPQPTEIKKGMLVKSNNRLYCDEPYVVGKVVNGDAHDMAKIPAEYIPVEYLDILEDTGAYE